MIYVVSDLHGYPLSDFKQLLKKADFGDDDFLYILGDIIDRNGDGGVEMLRWLLVQPNIQLLLGNHEAMLLACDFILDTVDDFLENSSNEKTELLLNYFQNGGDVTLKSLRELKKQSPDELYDIFDYLRDCPLYETVTAGENDYFLVHGGIDNFDKNKKIADYTADELIMSPFPKLTDEYFDGIMTVFGHTPTMSYGEEYRGKIIKTSTWLNIDVGTGFGESPVLLRLDDMKEFR